MENPELVGQMVENFPEMYSKLGVKPKTIKKNMNNRYNEKFSRYGLGGDQFRGSSRVDSPGDNADRAAIINSGGGDVYLQVKNDKDGRPRISKIG